MIFKNLKEFRDVFKGKFTDDDIKKYYKKYKQLEREDTKENAKISRNATLPVEVNVEIPQVEIPRVEIENIYDEHMQRQEENMQNEQQNEFDENEFDNYYSAQNYQIEQYYQDEDEEKHEQQEIQKQEQERRQEQENERRRQEQENERRQELSNERRRQQELSNERRRQELSNERRQELSNERRRQQELSNERRRQKVLPCNLTRNEKKIVLCNILGFPEDKTNLEDVCDFLSDVFQFRTHQIKITGILSTSGAYSVVFNADFDNKPIVVKISSLVHGGRRTITYTLNNRNSEFREMLFVEHQHELNVMKEMKRHNLKNINYFILEDEGANKIVTIGRKNVAIQITHLFPGSLTDLLANSLGAALSKFYESRNLSDDEKQLIKERIDEQNGIQENYIESVARMLFEFHQKGFSHGDFHSSNILYKVNNVFILHDLSRAFKLSNFSLQNQETMKEWDLSLFLTTLRKIYLEVPSIPSSMSDKNKLREEGLRMLKFRYVSFEFCRQYMQIRKENHFSKYNRVTLTLIENLRDRMILKSYHKELTTKFFDEIQMSKMNEMRN
jgi:hypothetical protein